MREQTGMVFTAPSTELAPVIPIRSSQPKTMEDAMTKEVANENARAIAFLSGQVPGVKRVDA